MRVHLLGGFLGAGKTTLAIALARRLNESGDRVALITNDQGEALVDTTWCGDTDASVQEITRGCFCCRFDELEGAILRAQDRGATTVIAEAVGSCADLVATVLSPLQERQGRALDVAPFTVVVDPWRVREVEAGGMAPDVAYLFRKQIAEADVILMSRADLDPPDVRDWLRELNGRAVILPVSGTSGNGLDEWEAATPENRAAPLAIDYDRYAAAEAQLGWSNGTVRVTSDAPFHVSHVITRFLNGLRDTPVAHVKVTTDSTPRIRAALVRKGGEPQLHGDAQDHPVRDRRLLVNARVALPPADLERRLRRAMRAAATPGTARWESFECFSPPRPVPQHRHTTRCTTTDDASCCATFYDRPDVRAVLGDSWHPGGVDLTLRMARHLALASGSRVLDVACGRGASLGALRNEWDIAATGLDERVRPGIPTTIEMRRGDAHAIPYPDSSFDAILCECALSTFTDVERAMAEMRRVVRPNGRMAISDMVVSGRLPEGLLEGAHLGTCLTGARSADGYCAAIREGGFKLIERWDVPEALLELLRRIKLRLVGAAFGSASGALPNVKIDMRRARELLAEARTAIQAGTLSYGVYIAEREV